MPFVGSRSSVMYINYGPKAAQFDSLVRQCWLTWLIMKTSRQSWRGKATFKLILVTIVVLDPWISSLCYWQWLPLLFRIQVNLSSITTYLNHFPVRSGNSRWLLLRWCAVVETLTLSWLTTSTLAPAVRFYSRREPSICESIKFTTFFYEYFENCGAWFLKWNNLSDIISVLSGVQSFFCKFCYVWISVKALACDTACLMTLQWEKIEKIIAKLHAKFDQIFKHCSVLWFILSSLAKINQFEKYEERIMRSDYKKNDGRYK